MRYLKQTTISLLILTALSSSFANQHKATTHKANVAHTHAKPEQHHAELERLKQRATFLQLESLLKSAVKNNSVFINQTVFLKLIEDLKGYPLQTDAIAAYFDACIKSVNHDTSKGEVKALKQDIEQFIEKHPTHFLREKLEQRLFTLFINTEDLEGLVGHAQRVKPKELETQLAVLNAEYQLGRKRAESDKNPNANVSKIIARYEQLWLNNSELPNDAQLREKW